MAGSPATRPAPRLTITRPPRVQPREQFTYPGEPPVDLFAVQRPPGHKRRNHLEILRCRSFRNELCLNGGGRS